MGYIQKEVEMAEPYSIGLPNLHEGTWELRVVLFYYCRHTDIGRPLDNPDVKVVWPWCITDLEGTIRLAQSSGNWTDPSTWQGAETLRYFRRPTYLDRPV